MKRLEDMAFVTTQNRDGRWVGTVNEFPSLRTMPKANRLDAISEIVSMAAERSREIECEPW